jgi:hypothetical protein
MTPYYPDYPARDGHPYMFALEGNAGTVKKLQAHPDPKADEPRSASRTARNGYRATKQNLHDLVLKNAGPKNKAADDSLSNDQRRVAGACAASSDHPSSPRR